MSKTETYQLSVQMFLSSKPSITDSAMSDNLDWQTAWDKMKTVHMAERHVLIMPAKFV